MAYNIAQVNSSMLKDAERKSPPLGITLPNDDTGEVPDYIVALKDKRIIKLGYCCEPKGHIYPIFLKMNGVYSTPFYIGKDGMYEMQKETFQDANSSEEESTSEVIITEVMVPADIDFTLEYATMVL